MYERLEDFSDRLMPMVRSRAGSSIAALEHQLAFGASQRLALPQQILAGDLIVQLGIDEPETIRTVENELLSKVGLNFEQALEIARSNIIGRFPEMHFDRVDGGGDIYFVSGAEDYQSSLLVLPAAAFLGNLEIEGEPVVLVPSRGQMLVAGSADTAALTQLAAIAGADPSDLPHPCSAMLFTPQGDRWTPYTPPAHTDAAQIYERSLKYIQGYHYAQQAARLEAIHEAARKDVHVAELKLFEKDGRFETVASWVNGITDGWLPKADVIAFVDNGADSSNVDAAQILFVPWEQSLSVAGGLLTEIPDLYPTRFRYTQFPDKAQWQALQAKAQP
ncbi:MAG: hypothetical protein R3D67_11300 [Hyphomicrobiaceae bacterium]